MVGTPTALEAAHQFLDAVAMSGGVSAHARATSTPHQTVSNKKIRCELIVRSAPKKPFQIEDLPDTDLDVKDIISHMKKVTSRQIAAFNARQLIDIKINIEGPMGLVHVGDPHIDNHGCDWTKLEQDIETISSTDGMVAGNIGDTHDNWAGRLTSLYALNPTTRGETRKLIEWLARSVPWLYWILGNHDLWSGGSDIIEFMKKSSGAFEAWKTRLALQFPNGREIRINAQHDHKGASSWNAMHGPLKAVMLGHRDHIVVAGHKHQSGYMIDVCPNTGLLSHLIRVAGYKRADEYVVVNGFQPRFISPTTTTIIDPSFGDDDPRQVMVLFDLQQAAEVLTWMRKRHLKGKSTNVVPPHRVRRAVHS